MVHPVWGGPISKVGGWGYGGGLPAGNGKVVTPSIPRKKKSRFITPYLLTGVSDEHEMTLTSGISQWMSTLQEIASFRVIWTLALLGSSSLLAQTFYPEFLVFRNDSS